MTNFRLKIITPDKMFFDGTAVQLIARTAEGDIGILAGHTPYVANINPSSLKVKENEGDEFKVAAVAGGFLKVSPEEAVVVTNAVEWAEDIDIARAEAAKARAEAIIKKHESDKEFERAEQKLKRAVNRLAVSDKH